MLGFRLICLLHSHKFNPPQETSDSSPSPGRSPSPKPDTAILPLHFVTPGDVLFEQARAKLLSFPVTPAVVNSLFNALLGDQEAEQEVRGM